MKAEWAPDQACSRYRPLNVRATVSTSLCSIGDAISLYCAANAIFVKVGRSASDELIPELILKKCVPIPTYDLEVRALP